MNRQFLKNIVIVLFSNFFVLLSGIVMGVYLPKILSVEEYGIYKIFTLYLSYAGFTHLGFPNGLYLRLGGEDYTNINIENMKGYFRFYFIQQITISIFIFTLVACVNSVFSLNNQFEFIFFIIIEFLIINLTLFFELISQAVGKFKIFSFMKTLKAILTLVFLFALYECNIYLGICAEQCILVYIFIDIVILICYLCVYNNIVIYANTTKIKQLSNNIKEFYRIGFPMLLVGIISNVLLIIDRQVVSIWFDKETYAVYAFAYSMINLVTVLISSVAIVMYPSLKKLNKEDALTSYCNNIRYVLIIVTIFLSIYFPISKFIIWFLPNYEKANTYFRILFPGIGLSCAISVVIANYYKLLDEMNKYFNICLLVLVFSIFSNVVAYFIWKTPDAISVASIITIVVWFLISDIYICRKYKKVEIGNYLMYLFVMGLFYLATGIKNCVLGLITYLIMAILINIYFLLFRKVKRNKLNS